MKNIILFYSEIFQQTGPIERAARLMASHGYAVLVPEVFHELNPIGTVLGYDDAGRDKGNADKENKDVQGYDTDNEALIKFAKQQSWCNGQFGAMGYCIGGHLAFRAALQPEVKGTACFYATDLHIQKIPNKPGQHSMERLAERQRRLQEERVLLAAAPPPLHWRPKARLPITTADMVMPAPAISAGVDLTTPHASDPPTS